MADTHKTVPTEFKLEAIKLSQQPGHTASSAARDLGIPPYLIHRRIRQQAKHEGAGKPSFPGRGDPALTQQEAEIQRLKRELETAKQERDILKKALAGLGLNSPVLAKMARLGISGTQRAIPPPGPRRPRGLGRFFAKFER